MSNQPRTLETCRRQDDVFGYELQFLLSGVIPVFQSLNYKLKIEDCLMCCPSNRDSTVVLVKYLYLYYIANFFQPEYEDGQANAGRNCRDRLVRPNFQARMGTRK